MRVNVNRTKLSSLRQAGFTLIEMVLVLAIIAVLVGGAIGLLGNLQGDAKKLRVKADFKAIESALTMYETKALRLPTGAQGLKALVEKPTLAPIPRSWSNQMKKVPLDPWGAEYVYRAPGKTSRYDLVSAGEDGIIDAADDIGSWEDDQ